ncbi:PREDICTED: uncharacterized protein LOC108760021 [Trachymyrmex cornetzi]|uniref:uncharacterized protein LOC108760021 n=1 Tax=Trachymyrmex cornetzi TaxID=471704 RepID=UPI00084F5E25|nr:PREDICTED: uncharacterized protein LOC108760021 [Trachymyrmex cornetzi]
MPMGSPLSPVIADIVLQDLEKKALDTLGFYIPFYVRYVDDIAMGIPCEKTSEILNIFNSFHPRLQFTMEIGGSELNFLDITIIKNERLEFDWYHKPTFSGRYLNFLSEHPLSQKKGVIMGMVDRAFLLSVPKYHKKNLIFVIETLLNNDYPMDFIFNVISERLKSLLHGKTLRQNTENELYTDDTRKMWFSFPYVTKVLDKFRDIIKDFNVNLAFFSNKLNCFIKTHKDPVPNLAKRNVMYKINCNDCDASYVGQTKRTVKTRITEHRNDIRKTNSNHSVITEHRLNFNHDFDWDKVEIVDNERFLYKRRIAEMIHIQLQKNGLNSQSDTEFLHHAYISILNDLN